MESFSRIKGIVLGGGQGKRLAPLTHNDNKHLLPVYDRRMIEYPVKTLVDAGIRDVILITGGNRPGAFLELFKNGKDYGLDRIYYTYQEGSGGIADALKLAKPFIGEDEETVVILGDNYFEDGIKNQVECWAGRSKAPYMGASCLLKDTDSPWEFGMAELKDKYIIDIQEKPRDIKPNRKAILGCYFFDYSVWKFLDEIEPSARGELEVTDLLNLYLKNGLLSYDNYDGFWSDMGSFESWTKVSQRVAHLKETQCAKTQSS